MDVVNILSAVKLLGNPCVYSICTDVVDASKVDPLWWSSWGGGISSVGGSVGGGVGGGVGGCVDKSPLRREEQLLAEAWCEFTEVNANVPTKNEVGSLFENAEGDDSSVTNIL